MEIDLTTSDQPKAFKKKRKQDRLDYRERVFREYQLWLEETQTTDSEPYIQIIAVVTGKPHE